MPKTAANQELLVVTGMSGAGRSTVGNALEDLGWYVVDNLPPQMLLPLVELAARAGNALPRIAAVVDVRGGRLFSDVQQAIESIGAGSANVRILFLEATDSALVRRFEQVRRPHPLQGDGTLLDGIMNERERMAEIRELSDIVIDTTDLNIHQLATAIIDKFAAEDAAGLRLTIVSFGFKYGVPTDVDLVADARFLPNPFWMPDLKALTGIDQAVKEYVLAQPGAEDFIRGYAAALRPVFDGYQRENKRHATIAIGCTGGKHRSVAVAEELARVIASDPGIAISVKHRDLGRE
ncbi:MAG: RNase adapter RapZ [Salinibacterium sp.]|nr:RNase adapter RapZ [Salinibacterium sp.]